MRGNGTWGARQPQVCANRLRWANDTTCVCTTAQLGYLFGASWESQAPFMDEAKRFYLNHCLLYIHEQIGLPTWSSSRQRYTIIRVSGCSTQWKCRLICFGTEKSIFCIHLQQKIACQNWCAFFLEVYQQYSQKHGLAILLVPHRSTLHCCTGCHYFR